MRREGWELILVDYIRSAETLKFIWGENDCALWAARFVDQVTGSQHAEEWAGKYTTEEECKDMLRDAGFESHIDLAASRLPEKPVAFASRGDIVLHPEGALGICDGRRSYFLMLSGRTDIPTIDCLRAWRV